MKKIWSENFKKRFKKALDHAERNKRLNWKKIALISVPSGSLEKECGLPLVRTGQGRNRDYYDPEQQPDKDEKILDKLEDKKGSVTYIVGISRRWE